MLAYAKANGITDFAVPKIVHIVPTLPLLGSGKIDYTAIVALINE